MVAPESRVTYGGLLRFAAVGITLSVYIDTGLDLAGIRVPFWFFIALALTVGYVVFGTYVSIPPPMEDMDLDREPEDWRGSRDAGYDDGYQADEGGFKPGMP